MLQEHIRSGHLFGICPAQRTMDLMKLPELEIVKRSHAEILMKGGADGAFRHAGCCHQLMDEHGFAVAFLNEVLGPTDDLLSRKLRSSFVNGFARLSFSHNRGNDVSQFHRCARRRGRRLELGVTGGGFGGGCGGDEPSARGRRGSGGDGGA